MMLKDPDKYHKTASMPLMVSNVTKVRFRMRKADHTIDLKTVGRKCTKFLSNLPEQM